jgi:hypothetical protein
LNRHHLERLARRNRHRRLHVHPVVSRSLRAGS